METNRIFRGFCIYRFGIGPLHYILSRSDFGFEFSEIFVFEKRLPDSTIRGVSDSPYQQNTESATLRLNDTGIQQLSASLIRGVDDSPHHRYGESAIEFFKRKLDVSVIRRVVDSAYPWYGESPTPRIIESGSHRLRISLIRRVADSKYRGVDDSAYLWYEESLVEKKISLASIFSTLNGWSMPLKGQFGRKLARDVIYY
jgi:hypothetical protein